MFVRCLASLSELFSPQGGGGGRRSLLANAFGRLSTVSSSTNSSSKQQSPTPNQQKGNRSTAAVSVPVPAPGGVSVRTLGRLKAETLSPDTRDRAASNPIIMLKPQAAPEAYKLSKRGFLQKEGHVNKNWNRRYFVLENNTLSYYTDVKCGDRKGSVLLTERVHIFRSVVS